jgi:hypothetical protein
MTADFALTIRLTGLEKTWLGGLRRRRSRSASETLKTPVTIEGKGCREGEREGRGLEVSWTGQGDAVAGANRSIQQHIPPALRSFWCMYWSPSVVECSVGLPLRMVERLLVPHLRTGLEERRWPGYSGRGSREDSAKDSRSGQLDLGLS